jgi:hypothetical protein
VSNGLAIFDDLVRPEVGGERMRRLTLNAFLSVDGVMQAPGMPEEDRRNQFAHVRES